MLGEQLKMLEADLPARNLHPLAEPPLVWEVDNRTEYFSEWFSLTYRKPKFSLRGKQSFKLRYFVGGQGARARSSQAWAQRFGVSIWDVDPKCLLSHPRGLTWAFHLTEYQKLIQTAALLITGDSKKYLVTKETSNSYNIYSYIWLLQKCMLEN